MFHAIFISSLYSWLSMTTSMITADESFHTLFATGLKISDFYKRLFKEIELKTTSLSDRQAYNFNQVLEISFKNNRYFLASISNMTQIMKFQLDNFNKYYLKKYFDNILIGNVPYYALNDAYLEIVQPIIGL